MKAKKIFGYLLLLILFVIGLGGYWLYSNFDSLVKQLIEQQGSAITGTPVRVGGVNFELAQGLGEISDLRVENPVGFDETNALQLGRITLQIEPASINDPVLVINQLALRDTAVTLEHKGVAQTNLKALLDNIRSNTAGGEAPEDEEAGPEKLFAVNKLILEDISVNLVSDQLENRSYTLPAIERSQLGSPENGLTAAQLAQAIVEPLIDQARDRLEGELRGRVKDKLEDTVKENLPDEAKEKLEGLKNLLNRD